MMTIIHGDDIAASRTYYKTLQKKETIVLDGEKVTKQIIAENLQSSGFFDEQKTISLENFWTKRKTSKETDEIIQLLKMHEKQTDILFWDNKQITKKLSTIVPTATIKVFPFPQSLFIFLDALQPNNGQKLLTLFHQTLEHTEAEMIFFMINRQIRILLALSDDSPTDTIDEVKRLSPWQKSKLVSLSRQFSVKQLKALHATLFDIDVKSKTGGLAMPLSKTIDFLLLSI